MIVFSKLAFFFFFKQKTAYEMRISDWSSDVCSSDLICHRVVSRKYPLEFIIAVLTNARIEMTLGDLPQGATHQFDRDHQASRQYVEIGRASCRERVCQYV